MTRRRAAARALAVAAALALAPAAARADGGAATLGRAQAALDDMDYDGARALAAEALAAGHLTAADLARAHMIAGQVAAALGDADGARDHFVRWILLAPDAALPAGVSPKIAQPFDAARARARALGPMTLEIHVRRGAGTIAATVDGDPLHLADHLRLRTDGGADVTAAAPRVEAPADDRATVAVTVTVLDERDDELAVHETTALPSSTAAAEARDDDAPPPHRVPAGLRWPTWAGVAVVAGGAAGYFSYRLGQDQDQLAALNASSTGHTFDEARALEDRGHRDATIANVSLGVAAVAVVAGVVTFVVDRPGHKVELQPLAGPGAAGAAATLHF